MSDERYPAWPDLFRWLTVLKDRVETLPVLSAEQVVTGTFDPSLIPPIPWDDVLKTGSSLGDLEIRSASDLSSGTLSPDRMPGLTGDVSSVVGSVATTLATVNTSPGSFGSGTLIPIVTVNGKGLVTAVTQQPIQTGALTRVNDTNVTATLGGTPATALLKDVSITLGWTGTLAVTRGGTGTGTAFTAGSVVFAGTSGVYAQDNANLFWDDTNNRLGVGIVSPLAKLHVLDTISTSPRGILSSQISTDTNGARVGFSKARGTLGAETIVVTGDTLGRLMFRGYDGANYLEMASIEAGASDTVALTRIPTFLAFSTATDAAPSVLTEQLRIASTGRATFTTAVNIGTGGAFGILHARKDQNADTDAYVANGTSGTTARAILSIQSSLGGINLHALSAGWTTSGLNIAGYGVLNTDGAMLGMVIRTNGAVPILFGTSNTERMRIDSSGRLGIGVTSPTAMLHLKAGTATANTAPLKFNSGTLLTTAEAGAVEFLTDAFYGTITTGAARKTFAFLESPSFTTPDIGAATGASLALTAAIGKYKNVNTAGWGIAAIYGSGRSTAQVAAVASVATYTNGAADGSFVITANVNVTTSTTHNFNVQVDYTDETNTAQTLTLTFSQLSGVLVTAITNVTGAGPYEGVSVRIRCKASTAITVKTTGTFTTVTYNVEAAIQQLA